MRWTTNRLIGCGLRSAGASESSGARSVNAGQLNQKFSKLQLPNENP